MAKEKHQSEGTLGSSKRNQRTSKGLLPEGRHVHWGDTPRVRKSSREACRKEEGRKATRRHRGAGHNQGGIQETVRNPFDDTHAMWVHTCHEGTHSRHPWSIQTKIESRHHDWSTCEWQIIRNTDALSGAREMHRGKQRRMVPEPDEQGNVIRRILRPDTTAENVAIAGSLSKRARSERRDETSDV